MALVINSRTARRLLTAGAVVALTFLLLPPAAAQPGNGAGKLSTELDRRIHEVGGDDLVAVIVQTFDRPSAAHFARLHGRGGQLKRGHAAIRGYSARIPAGQIAAFTDDPEIERVSLDAPVRAHMDVAYRAVRADVAAVDTGGLNGSGVGVALIDTGVAAHEDLLRPRGAPSVLEVEVVGREPGLADYYGHGTHVAGIIAGNGAASSMKEAFRQFRGIAPGVSLISVRALEPDGSGYTSDVLTGIDWVIANRTRYNIRVLNLSLGHPVFESYATDPLCRAARAAVQAGIVVVVAAGNDGAVGSGFGTITSPGNEPSVITVGAVDDSNTVTTGDDILAWYSSRGPSLIDYVVKPDLVAPGSWIVSLRAAGSRLDTEHHDLALQASDYRTMPVNGDKDGDYYTLAGTSMAAPMVAATAALMIQKEPGLNPGSVKARLMLSAVKDERLVFETGAGFLDVAGALQATGHAAAAPSPRAVLHTDGYIYMNDLGELWGDALVWGWDRVLGSHKARLYGIDMGDTDEETLAALGAVWGGKRTKSGSLAVVENNQVTGSSLIWNGQGSWLMSTTGAVDILGAVWGGRRK